MKTSLIALSLTLLGACATARPDLVRTDGVAGRQIERVLTRHDDYVLGDAEIAPLAAEEALAQSDAVRSLVLLGEVSPRSLGAVLSPVANRHDDYVRADPELDVVARETYLASTEQLRRLSRISGP